MFSTAFGACLILSILVLLWTASKNYEMIDRYYWSLVILIPLVNLAYWLKTTVVSAEAAAICFCFIYIDSTVVLTIVIFLMLRTIRVNVKRPVKVIAYGAAVVHLFVIWGCVHNDLYFKTITVIPSDAGSITKVAGGPLRIYHYIYLAVIFAAIIGILIAGLVKRGTYSRRTLYIYALFTALAIVTYGVEWAVDINFSLLPFLYTLADILLAIQFDRIYMHDISWLVSCEQRNSSLRGFAAFDADGRFLSSNTKIFEFCPELAEQRVDERLPEESPLRLTFYSMIEAYERRGESSTKITIGGMTCACRIAPFTLSRTKACQGYIISMRDATEEQKNLDLITSYNDRLNAEISAKTNDILDMQSRIVTGMANMIENRDNNTGGHVKRTSDIIRIVIDEICRQGLMDIDEGFARDIVRAAPMHDLGKISIENAILNKPAKLTDEEYEIMKSHAKKSGEMVMILLDGVEEEHFVQVAYHVARYHHERWDGRGYPDGLVGSMIPVEARIMAVADVYDALASRRSYKEPMDPKLVAKIMLEGMGTQFDPNMKPVFIGCRKRLEAYYQKVNKE